MHRALSVTLLVCILLSACTQRMICPAYQSAFIYDQDQLRKRFSYFQEDSTPKILTASRNKYLIAESQPYKKRVRGLQTVQMKPVFVSLPDSLKPEDQREMDEEGIDGEDGVVEGSELDLAARSVVDSTYIVDVPQEEPPKEEDSVYMISKDKELRLLKYNMPDSLVYDASTGKYVPQKPKYTVVNVTFNVEQDNYMWYLRDYLVLPDVRLASIQQRNKGNGDEGGSSKSGKKSKKEKGIKGFFKNLFGKKKKEEEAPEEVVPQGPVDEEETFDYIEEDEQAKPPVADPANEEPEEQKVKKERKKKERKKKKSEDTDVPVTPPVEEETITPPVEEPRDEDSF
jgi:hypothetical protein